MNKNSIICKSCGADNLPSSEFCIECGAEIGNNLETEVTQPEKTMEKRRKEYNDWKRSVPFTISAIIFITFIDFITGGSAFGWSYWATVPILLFAILAPYFSFKMVKDD